MDSHNESEKYSLESTPPIEATSDNASVIALRVHLVVRTYKVHSVIYNNSEA